MLPPSDTVTEGLRVRAVAEFVHTESGSGAERFVYVYRINFNNEGDRQARLLARHWIIVDADGRRHDVRGDGVVGDFPTLEPGGTYHYTSWCPLTTEWGTMEGEFTFERTDGTTFEAKVGRFYLTPDSAFSGVVTGESPEHQSRLL